jgi:hypothetical protein
MKTNTDCSDGFMVFDPEKEVWISKKPMKWARYATGCFLIKDRLYVVGKK